ncbi:MAG: hypothetical protein QOJ40_255 [Verrucomicrobiota bacterium]
MSLMRLLSSGRSWVGLKESTRYRMSDPRAMPKFGSGNDLFRRATTKPGPATMSEFLGSNQVETKSPPASANSDKNTFGAATKSRPAVMTLLTASPNSGSRPKKTDREPSWARSGQILRVAIKFTSRFVANALQLGKALGSRTVILLRKLGSLFPRRRSRPRTAAIAGFARGPLQGELSLDRIKVVRNDLSDVDLEVVRRSEKGPAAAPLMADAPARTNQETGGEAWAPATAGLIGIGKT